jgi:hypothetical protein
MRTASRVLGIVGGCMAIVFSLVIIFAGVMFAVVIPSIENSEFHIDVEPDNDFYDSYNFDDETLNKFLSIPGFIFFCLRSLIFISGVLGLVGGILVTKRNVLSGVLMLVGGAICLVIIWAFLIAVLLIIGGIFALVNENKPPIPQQVA